jgi:hypothetical protein
MKYHVDLKRLVPRYSTATKAIWNLCWMGMQGRRSTEYLRAMWLACGRVLGACGCFQGITSTWPRFIIQNVTCYVFFSEKNHVVCHVCEGVPMTALLFIALISLLTSIASGSFALLFAKWRTMHLFMPWCSHAPCLCNSPSLPWRNWRALLIIIF